MLEVNKFDSFVANQFVEERAGIAGLSVLHQGLCNYNIYWWREMWNMINHIPYFLSRDFHPECCTSATRLKSSVGEINK